MDSAHQRSDKFIQTINRRENFYDKTLQIKSWQSSWNNTFPKIFSLMTIYPSENTLANVRVCKDCLAPFKRVGSEERFVTVQVPHKKQPQTRTGQNLVACKKLFKQDLKSKIDFLYCDLNLYKDKIEYKIYVICYSVF